jgi:sugar phosphate permease
VTFLFIKAKHGVSRCNLVSMFVVYLTLNLLVHTKLSLLSYLLVADYGFQQHESGEEVGKLGFYCDLAVIPSEFILGALMDVFGRKKMTVGGLMLSGTMFILFTQFQRVEPWLQILCTVNSIALIPAIIVPL